MKIRDFALHRLCPKHHDEGSNASVPLRKLFRPLSTQELYLSSQPEQIQSLTRCL